MPQKTDFSFRKDERLCSRRLIEQLFSGGGKSMSAYPLRVVFMPVASTETPSPAIVLVSVSKRHFKLAVNRNRVKRQVREAYRRHKHLLNAALERQPECHLLLAFLWLSDRLYSSAEVDRHVKHLLTRISERFAVSLSKEGAPHG